LLRWRDIVWVYRSRSTGGTWQKMSYLDQSRNPWLQMFVIPCADRGGIWHSRSLCISQPNL
jgi:hypothetical protein